PVGRPTGGGQVSQRQDERRPERGRTQRRGDGKAGACCGPEIPVIQTKLLLASSPPGLLPLRKRSPAGQANPPWRHRCRPGRPGPRAAARQASGRTKASRERRATRGAATERPGSTASLKIPDDEYQLLQASGLPGLLPIANMEANRCASLRQEASQARRAARRAAMAWPRPSP
ncbi:MAG TPA: hypothetical protein PLD96_06590, partial [Methanothrix sp.]|nr:hypothetical protein [Methanothrix sp.]